MEINKRELNANDEMTNKIRMAKMKKMNVYVEEVQGVKLFFHELKNGSNLLEECRPCVLVDFYKMFNREIL